MKYVVSCAVGIVLECKFNAAISASSAFLEAVPKDGHRLETLYRLNSTIDKQKTQVGCISRSGVLETSCA